MNHYMEKDSYWREGLKPKDLHKRAEVLGLSPRVDEAVRRRFELVRKLVAYSYYEVDFLEAALNRAVLTYEMALRRRYRKVCGSDEQKLNQSVSDEPEELHNLIGKAHSLGILGTGEKLGQTLRKLRNFIAHPEDHSRLGHSSWRLLLRVAEHIEALYEHPRSRKAKEVARSRLNKRIAHLAEVGAVLEGDALAEAEPGQAAQFQAMANPVARRQYQAGLFEAKRKAFLDTLPSDSGSERFGGGEDEAEHHRFRSKTSTRWVIAGGEVLHVEQGEEGLSFYIGFTPAYDPDVEAQDGPVVFPHLLLCVGWDSVAGGSLRFESHSGNYVFLRRELSSEERQLHKKGRRGQVGTAPLSAKLTLGRMKAAFEGREATIGYHTLDHVFLVT